MTPQARHRTYFQDQAEQIRAISVERVGNLVGAVPAYLMLQVDAALRLHLSL